MSARSILGLISDFINVPVQDPDWQRRGRILNMLIFGLTLIAFLVGALNYAVQQNGTLYQTSSRLFMLVAGASIIFNVAVYIISRYRSVRLGATIYLTLLTFLMFLGDTPEQTLWGRNMITLVVPILMASLILQPVMSIVMAGLIGVMSVAMAFFNQIEPNFTAVITYFVIAVITWLTTRNLDKAVSDLRTTNLELDNRISERTAALRDANERLEDEIVEKKQIEYALEKERKLLAFRVNERTAEILATNEELKRMAKVKDEFLANMSHELRTPLNAIIGYGEGILEESEIKRNLGEIYIEDTHRVIHSGKHLLSLINSILDLSKIESNQLVVKNETVQLQDLIKDIRATIQPMMDKHFNQFQVELSPGVVEIRTDYQKLKQILLNLLSNAAKFTKEGIVTLRISPTLDEGLIAFDVIDTGVGIPGQALERIFESFRQIDNSHSRSFDGTGLGLTISKRLAHILKGRIEVESEPGTGTTFTLLIPETVIGVQILATDEAVE